MLNLTRDSVSFVERPFQVELLEGTTNEHTGKTFSNAKWKHVPTLVDHSKRLILMSDLSIKKKFVNNAGKNFKTFNALISTGLIILFLDLVLQSISCFYLHSMTSYYKTYHLLIFL